MPEVQTEPEPAFAEPEPTTKPEPEPEAPEPEPEAPEPEPEAPEPELEPEPEPEPEAPEPPKYDAPEPEPEPQLEPFELELETEPKAPETEPETQLEVALDETLDEAEPESLLEAIAVEEGNDGPTEAESMTSGLTSEVKATPLKEPKVSAKQDGAAGGEVFPEDGAVADIGELEPEPEPEPEPETASAHVAPEPVGMDPNHFYDDFKPSCAVARGGMPATALQLQHVFGFEVTRAANMLAIGDRTLLTVRRLLC